MPWPPYEPNSTHPAAQELLARDGIPGYRLETDRFRTVFGEIQTLVSEKHARHELLSIGRTGLPSAAGRPPPVDDYGDQGMR
jgi:hypothetical protein